MKEVIVGMKFEKFIEKYEWLFSLPVLMGTLVFLLMLGLSNSSYGSDRAPYGTTWQIKCEQKGTGQEVQCWMVEVPNKPVVGIDIPFPEEEK